MFDTSKSDGQMKKTASNKKLRSYMCCTRQGSPCDGTHALTTWLLLRNLDKASLEFAMNYLT